jgi:thymidine phosphorylase
VLGSSCGNALEVLEAVDFLTGQWREPRLLEVTRTLSAELLVMGGLADADAQALQQVDDALSSGRALEQFARMVAALGGPTDFCERPGNYLPTAPVQMPVLAPRSGFVTHMATRDIGLTVVELGGGRRRASDTIDARVGMSQFAQIGQAVQTGDVLAMVHAADATSAEQARQTLLAKLHISDLAPTQTQLLVKRICRNL